jgi:hypothetical protein
VGLLRSASAGGERKEKGEMESNDLYRTMLGSATAGLFSRLVSHPLDTCKTRMLRSPHRSIFLFCSFSIFFFVDKRRLDMAIC